jgi:hypothetical protein
VRRALDLGAQPLVDEHRTQGIAPPAARQERSDADTIRLDTHHLDLGPLAWDGRRLHRERLLRRESRIRIGRRREAARARDSRVASADRRRTSRRAAFADSLGHEHESPALRGVLAARRIAPHVDHRESMAPHQSDSSAQV